MQSWDDFITHSADIEYDDLMVVIGARRTSVSFSTDLENLPAHLMRYHSAQNMLVIYPEQFGADVEMPEPIDDLLSQPYTTNPTPWRLSLTHLRDVLTAHLRRRHIDRLRRKQKK